MATNTATQPTGSRFRYAAGTLACMGLTAAIAAVDLRLPHVNVSIAFVLPMVLCIGLRRRFIWAWTIGLVLLTYADYVIKYLPQGNEPLSTLANYRFLNRSFVAMLLLVTTAIFHRRTRINQSQSFWETDRLDRDQTHFDYAGSRWVVELSMLLVTLTTAGFITLADWLTPGQINLPILYGVPLILCSLVHSSRLLWSMLVVMLVLTILDFFWGPAPTVQHQFVHTLLTNRTIASACLLGLAVTVQFFIWPKSDLR